MRPELIPWLLLPYSFRKFEAVPQRLPDVIDLGPLSNSEMVELGFDWTPSKGFYDETEEECVRQFSSGS